MIGEELSVISEELSVMSEEWTTQEAIRRGKRRGKLIRWASLRLARKMKVESLKVRKFKGNGR